MATSHYPRFPRDEGVYRRDHNLGACHPTLVSTRYGPEERNTHEPMSRIMDEKLVYHTRHTHSMLWYSACSNARRVLAGI